MKKLFLLFILILSSCSSMNYTKTVDKLDLNRFMGDWYVIAGRFTIFEKGAHNGLESYTWNQEKEQIDISFTFNKDSFDGKRKEITQTGWVYNQESKSHWKVRPFWPLKLDYLVIALADDYSWTAVGVPNGNYLWIMAREWDFSKKKVTDILKKLDESGYPINDIKYVPQKWN